MTCENFNDRLLEYLDEALSPAEQAASREHLRNCDACRRAVAREEAFAKSLQLSFSRRIQGLSLSASTTQSVLDSLQRQEAQPTAWARFQKHFAVLWRRPVWAAAAFLCLLLLFFSGQFYQHPVGNSAPLESVGDARNSCVIDVPIQTEMHIYRRENNRVVDAIVTEFTAINANFSESIPQSASHTLRQIQLKSP